MSDVILPPLLVLAILAHSLVRSVLCRPWQVKPIYRFLFVHSTWYRRWVMRRQVAALRQMNVAFAGLLPAARRASGAIKLLGEAFARAA